MTIFSRILSGEIPCHKIAEDDYFFSFLDIRPISKGHCLVVPRQEVDYLFDLDDATLANMMRFAKCVARGIDEATGCLRTGILVQGLDVPHAHIHLVPLYSEHTTLAFGSPVIVSSEEMATIATAISSRIHL